MPNLDKLTQQALRAEYVAARDAYHLPSWIQKLAVIMEGSDHSVRLPWLGGVANAMALRGMVDSANKPSVNYIDLAVAEYQSGVEIPLRDMRRDKVGAVSRSILLNELAATEAEHWEALFSAAIIAGESTEGYDGEYFFDIDHKDVGGSYVTNQSNDITQTLSTEPAVKSGTTTKPSQEDLLFAVGRAIETICAFRDANGLFVNRNAKSFVAMFPMSMWVTAVGASKSLLAGYGVDQVLERFLAGTGMSLEIVASPYLASWTAKFAVFRADHPRKPMIGLEEELEPDVALKVFEPENSDYAKANEVFKLVARANRAVKMGEWRNACLVTLA
jgi:phage major head subunit gpT-like protein